MAEMVEMAQTVMMMVMMMVVVMMMILMILMAMVMVINAALARGRLNHNHQQLHPEKSGVGFTGGVAFHRFSHKA